MIMLRITPMGIEILNVLWEAGEALTAKQITERSPVLKKNSVNVLVKRMMDDGYGDICLFIVFPVARYIERRWINFKPAGFTGKGIAVCLAGLFLMGVIMKYLPAPLDAALGGHWGHFMYQFIYMMFCLAAWPAVIKAVCNGSEE